MSEIGEIIKEIAFKGDKISTFPAIVLDNKPIEVEGKKEYVISVRLLLSADEYKIVEDEILLSSSGSGETNTTDRSGSKVELHNVRLRANVNGKEEGIMIIPRVGSWVLVSTIDNNEAKTYVSKYSEIDQVILRIKKPQESDKEGGGQQSSDDQEPEYFEVDFNATTLDVRFGDLFETHINKEQLNVKFLQPKEESANEGEDPPPQKMLSELKYVKDNLDITFLDDEEKPRATVHADQENLNISFIEDEKVTSETLLNKANMSFNFKEDDELKLSAVLDKDKVNVTVRDGCSAIIEKDKAILTTDGGAEEISVDKNAGVTLKSSSDINIEAGGDVNIKGASVNVN